jgi:hypothetical protein
MRSFIQDPKRLLATIIAGVVGMVVFVDSLGSVPLISPVATLLVTWTATLLGLALLIGLGSVIGTHFQRVASREPTWGYSAVLLFAMFTVIALGIFGVPGQAFPVSLSEEPLRLSFRLIYEPLASSLLALMAFFSLSAILRAIHQRRAEAICIILVALVVLLAQTPLVARLAGVDSAVVSFKDYIVLAGARSILLGTALGTMVASLRILLGFDQPYLDR